MADIFISYAREDRAVAAVLAKALEGCGWSVWWDRVIPPGKTFDEVIEAELTIARCAIVLWSKAAVASRWVREEAQEAVNRGKLVPAMLDGAEPPMGFRRIHAAELAAWRGDDGHAGWQDLKGAIGNLLGESSRRDAKAARTQSSEPPRATDCTQFRLNPKTPRTKSPADLMGLPLWTRHGISLLFGLLLWFLSFGLLCAVFDEADFVVRLSPAIVFAVLGSTLFAKFAAKPSKALKGSRFCNRHVMFCGLCISAISFFIVLHGGAPMGK